MSTQIGICIKTKLGHIVTIYFQASYVCTSIHLHIHNIQLILQID